MSAGLALGDRSGAPVLCLQGVPNCGIPAPPAAHAACAAIGTGGRARHGRMSGAVPGDDPRGIDVAQLSRPKGTAAGYRTASTIDANRFDAGVSALLTVPAFLRGLGDEQAFTCPAGLGGPNDRMPCDASYLRPGDARHVGRALRQRPADQGLLRWHEQSLEAARLQPLRGMQGPFSRLSPAQDGRSFELSGSS